MSENNIDFESWKKAHTKKLQTVLDTILPPVEYPLERLHSAMRYSVLASGKRIRPLLVFASGEMVEASEKSLYLIASAVECVHVYSLIHDDLPCMDNDDLRRGIPTCHKKFDYATALLAGDALQTFAFEILTSHSLCFNPQQQLGMIQLLAQASGSTGMVGGQTIDIEHVNQSMSLEELEKMHSLKTGALIRASVLLGASASEEPLSVSKWENLDIFARKIGLCFQIVDDILDATADTITLGKTAGKDLEDNKPTFVSLLGVDKAKEYAEKVYSEGISALECFGDKAIRLKQIADLIKDRIY